MDHNLYNWITTPIIWGIWLYIAISGIKSYIRTARVRGMSSFITKKELETTQNPEIIAAAKAWKRKTKKLFLIWVITLVVFMALSIIIDRTIGFKN